MKPAKVVAELGATHIGDMDRAKYLIRLAAFAGADYVKLQKRNPIESVAKELQNKPHPNQMFSYGKTYLKHRQNLELTKDQHKELQEYCGLVSIGYSSSVWDVTSARDIISLNPDFIKVGSPTNMNFGVLGILRNEYEGDIHISLGMITPNEKQKIFDYLFDEHDNSRFVIYHCTSEYPCPFERLYLNEITELKETIPEEVRIGFSDHGKGIAVDIAAYAFGAEWIERHFIDDRTFRHSDASASLEPDGLRRLCRDLKAVYTSLQWKKEMSEEELTQRKKLRGSND